MADVRDLIGNAGGSLGPLEFDLGLTPQTRIGVSLDAGVIKGGGFLIIDIDKGECIGVLELSLLDLVTLKAIGILNTKMPDGSDGLAVLILITAEFIPIQLGFGFTLIGVGGLLALDRSLDSEALRIGVRTGALNSIMFPKDILANINKIVSDLKTIFPIVRGHFVIGPMGKLGWGTPALITLDIGVILDIPQPMFVILGALRCILPTEDAAILKLQVNFAGGVDFGRGMIWFDASLFDSRLLIYTLTGDMALRIGWGEQTIFVISVGGFHPAFKEIPPDLRNMQRMSISLLSGDNPRITWATYFAVTSNTVQNGASVELYAAACGFSLQGRLGYDLLVQFNPFYFIADLYASLSICEDDDELFGINVHCQLSGPTPFNANGEASFKILFLKVSIHFNVTWGDEGPAQIQQTVNVLDLVTKAIQDDRNWTATMPANTHPAVTLRQIEQASDKIVVQPFGILQVSQKIVPLGLEISKFGNKKPDGPTSFDLTHSPDSTQETREEFALANFKTLSDTDKLNQKSFDSFRSGLIFATGDSSKFGVNVNKEVTYELSYLHKKVLLKIKGVVNLADSIFQMLARGSAVANSTFSVNKVNATIAPATIKTGDPEFHVVNVKDLSHAGAGMTARTSAEAYQLQDQLLAKNPSLRGQVMVVAGHELN
jgi:hypothetical protein